MLAFGPWSILSIGHGRVHRPFNMHIYARARHRMDPCTNSPAGMFWQTLLSFPRSRLARKKKEVGTKGGQRDPPEACAESKAPCRAVGHTLQRSCTEGKAWVARSLPLQRFSSNARLVRTDIRSDTDIVLVDCIEWSSSSSRALLPLHRAACNPPLSRAYSGLRMAMHRAVVDAQGNPSKAILSAERIEHDTQLIKSLEDVLVRRLFLRWPC